MSVTKQITVWCDGEEGGCGAWEQVLTSRADKARRKMRKMGWRRVGNKDICPDCAAKEDGTPQET